MSAVMPLTTLHPYPAYKPSGVPWLDDVPEHWETARLKGAVTNVVDLTSIVSKWFCHGIRKRLVLRMIFL